MTKAMDMIGKAHLVADLGMVDMAHHMSGMMTDMAARVTDMGVIETEGMVMVHLATDTTETGGIEMAHLVIGTTETEGMEMVHLVIGTTETEGMVVIKTQEVEALAEDGAPEIKTGNNFALHYLCLMYRIHKQR